MEVTKLWMCGGRQMFKIPSEPTAIVLYFVALVVFTYFWCNFVLSNFEIVYIRTILLFGWCMIWWAIMYFIMRYYRNR